MTSSTYGTAELQGDASPPSPKSYRLSKVAKIALALIVCGAAAVMAYPGTRPTIINFAMDQTGKVWDGIHGVWRSGGAAAVRPAPAKGSASLKDKVHQLNARVTAIERNLNLKRSARNPQDGKPTVAEVIEDLQARVAAIEKYLKAAGGSDNSRGRLSQAHAVYIGGGGGDGDRRLRGDQDSGGSDNWRFLDSYGGISNIYDEDGNRAGDGAAPVTTTIEDQVQDIEARVATIEKYLKACGCLGGSDNSRTGACPVGVKPWRLRRRLGERRV